MFILICLASVVGCGVSEDAAVVEARNEGRKAAFNVLRCYGGEDFVLESSVLDARIKQLSYLEAGDTACAKSFDEEFRQYIIDNNDRLAKELF